MHAADLKHQSESLQEKLHQLYTLNRHAKIDLSFRTPYLKLLEAFGNPHLSLPPVIHVAGTNGKGSIIAMLRAMLETEGYKVHAYTSPHLHQFNERIYLAGQHITDEALETLIDEALDLNQNRETTFFEITTVLAFAAFARTPADVTLLEVGMGGRLDCTNIVEHPIATIINTISYDHTEYLGRTLPEIAKEKAGIMKRDVPCIIGPQTQTAIDAGVIDIFKARAHELNAPLHLHGTDWFIQPHGSKMNLTIGTEQYTLPQPNLIGDHQINNAGTAIAALLSIKKKLPVSKKNLDKSLNRVEWQGRLEKIQSGSYSDDFDLWFDGGHNDNAAQALAVQLAKWQAEESKPLHIILGMKADKNPEEFLRPLLPYMDSLSLVPVPGIGDSITLTDIAPILTQENIPFSAKHETVTTTLEHLSALYDSPVRVLVCGSLYLADQIKR